jgi:hypothetical protein
MKIMGICCHTQDMVFCERKTMCKDFSISKKIFQENSQLSQQFCKLIQRVHGESKKSWNGKTEHKKT